MSSCFSRSTAYKQIYETVGTKQTYEPCKGNGKKATLLYKAIELLAQHKKNRDGQQGHTVLKSLVAVINYKLLKPDPRHQGPAPIPPAIAGLLTLTITVGGKNFEDIFEELALSAHRSLFRSPVIPRGLQKLLASAYILDKGGAAFDGEGKFKIEEFLKQESLGGALQRELKEPYFENIRKGGGSHRSDTTSINFGSGSDAYAACRVPSRVYVVRPDPALLPPGASNGSHEPESVSSVVPDSSRDNLRQQQRQQPTSPRTGAGSSVVVEQPSVEMERRFSTPSVGPQPPPMQRRGSDGFNWQKNSAGSKHVKRTKTEELNKMFTKLSPAEEAAAQRKARRQSLREAQGRPAEETYQPQQGTQDPPSGQVMDDQRQGPYIASGAQSEALVDSHLRGRKNSTTADLTAENEQVTQESKTQTVVNKVNVWESFVAKVGLFDYVGRDNTVRVGAVRFERHISAALDQLARLAKNDLLKPLMFSTEHFLTFNACGTVHAKKSIQIHIQKREALDEAISAFEGRGDIDFLVLPMLRCESGSVREFYLDILAKNGEVFSVKLFSHESKGRGIERTCILALQSMSAAILSGQRSLQILKELRSANFNLQQTPWLAFQILYRNKIKDLMKELFSPPQQIADDMLMATYSTAFNDDFLAIED